MHILKRHLEVIVEIGVGFVFATLSPAMLEMLILGNKSWLRIIVGIPIGLFLTVLGFVALVQGCSKFISLIKARRNELQKTLDEEEEASENPISSLLIRFREHYSDFFRKKYIKENEEIQWEATQLYRNILEFRKKRLSDLGITCEMIIHNIGHRMEYQDETPLRCNTYSDGKYNIAEVQEIIAAKTVYKKDEEIIHSRIEEDCACYTIVSPIQSGKGKIICPNCGAEATREELLDGCDYCGTKFIIQDLQERIAEFAFRPDYQVALAKYKSIRNRIISYAFAIILAINFIIFTCYAIASIPDFLSDPETGIFTTIASLLWVIVICSVCVIPLAILIYGWTFPVIIALFGINAASKAILKKLKSAPNNDLSFAEIIRQYDPNFSISNFYTGLQNKISSIIFAETEAQLHAFADRELPDMFGHYSDVINVEAEYMGITDYRVESSMQHITVDVNLKLTRYKKGKCRYHKERWTMEMVKAADCKTQVVCSPKVMTCQSCGSSLDLLRGKACSYCGNKLDLKQLDWVIDSIKS